jgi:hypothetical protein
MHALPAYLNGAGSNPRGHPVRDPDETLKVLDVLMRNTSIVRGGQKSHRDSPNGREMRRRSRSR